MRQTYANGCIRNSRKQCTTHSGQPPDIFMQNLFYGIAPFLPFNQANLFCKNWRVFKKSGGRPQHKKEKGGGGSLFLREEGEWKLWCNYLIKNRKIFKQFLDKRFLFTILYLCVIFLDMCPLFVKKINPHTSEKGCHFWLNVLKNIQRKQQKKKKKMSAGLCHCFLKWSECFNGKKNNVHPK